MKRLTFSTVPPRVERLDAQTARVNYDVEVGEETIAPAEDPETGEPTGEPDTHPIYTCQSVTVAYPVKRGPLVDAMIRQRYSVSDEFAILRQRDSKPEEFAEYNAFAESCKAWASEVLQ